MLGRERCIVDKADDCGTLVVALAATGDLEEPVKQFISSND